MFALRDGPRPADADGLLEAMAGIGWARKEGELYRAAIPVLTERHRAMVTGLLRIGRKALEEWFATNYAELKSAVADISPVRNRVPFLVAFDQIWHSYSGLRMRSWSRWGCSQTHMRLTRRSKGMCLRYMCRG